MAMLALRLLLLVCGATLAVGQQPAPAGNTAASPRAAEEEQCSRRGAAAEVVAAVQPEEGHEQRRELLTRAEAKRRKRCRKRVRVQNKLVKAKGNEKKERKLQRKLDKLIEKGITEACAPPAHCRRRRLQAPFVWDEEDKGSLSTDGFNPTSLGTMPTGSSHLIAVTQTRIDKFFTLTIGDGTQLSEIVLDDWDSDTGNQGFLALVTGDFVNVDFDVHALPDDSEVLGYGNHLYSSGRTSSKQWKRVPVRSASPVHSAPATTASGSPRVVPTPSPKTCASSSNRQAPHADAPGMPAQPARPVARPCPPSPPGMLSPAGLGK